MSHRITMLGTPLQSFDAQKSVYFFLRNTLACTMRKIIDGFRTEEAENGLYINFGIVSRSVRSIQTNRTLVWKIYEFCQDLAAEFAVPSGPLRHRILQEFDIAMWAVDKSLGAVVPPPPQLRVAMSSAMDDELLGRRAWAAASLKRSFRRWACNEELLGGLYKPGAVACERETMRCKRTFLCVN